MFDFTFIMCSDAQGKWLAQEKCLAHAILVCCLDMWPKAMTDAKNCWKGNSGLEVAQDTCIPWFLDKRNTVFYHILMLYLTFSCIPVYFAWFFLSCVCEKARPSLVGHYWNNTVSQVANIALTSSVPHLTCKKINCVCDNAQWSHFVTQYDKYLHPAPDPYPVYQA